jgi:hypothetical protein
MTLENRLALAVAGTLALAIAVLAAAILVLCHGHLIYSLDDPYISLALGEQIARGHYGINAVEASSPSSSILYPFLLAGFAWTPWDEFVPLAANTLAACAAGWLLAVEFVRSGIVRRPAEIPRAAALIVALCLAVNVVGLVFVGLEHSLHLLTSIFVVLGLARLLETGKLPRGLVAAIVLLPLWRFEGLALAGLAIAALALAAQRRAATIAAAAIMALLALYMTGMCALGLPPLPSSVLVKSDFARQAAEGAGLVGLWPGLCQDLWDHLRDSLRTMEAYPAFLVLLLLTAHPFLRWRGRAGASNLSLGREAIFVGVVAGSLLAHILFGAWGWFARYEAYALAVGAAGGIVVWRDALAALVRGGAMRTAAAAIVLLVTGQAYVAAEAMTPIASLGIYEQQYQMHRFAAEFYRRPVAVNDLGWVSYHNPNYVLDLWGLGSEAARTARATAAADPSWLEHLVERGHVGLTMIYDPWFAGQIPAGWRRVATLTAEHRMTSPFGTVAFYATSEDAAAALRDALAAFGRDIGPGTRLTLAAVAADAAKEVSPAANR